MSSFTLCFIKKLKNPNLYDQQRMCFSKKRNLKYCKENIEQSSKVIYIEDKTFSDKQNLSKANINLKQIVNPFTILLDH